MSYDIVDGEIDRGEHPKNPGDRAFGHGDQVTLELELEDSEDEHLDEDGKLPAGYFVNFTGNGSVKRETSEPNSDAVLKNATAEGELGTVHIRGAIRTAEDGDGEWPTIDEFDDGYLLALR